MLSCFVATATVVYAQDNVLVIDDAEAATQEDMRPYTELLEHTDVGMEMVPIPGGSFRRGSPEEESGRGDDEGPQKEIHIDPFWMGKYEVTWEQYLVWSERQDQTRRLVLALEATPRDAMVDGISKPTEPYSDMTFGMGKEQCPAICMTQHAARTFCQWLSAKTGRYYRLPTEAEWEYAARAGTTTPFSFGDDEEKLEEYGWFFDNSEDGYHRVGQKSPNAWGLFDMHGNVSEWVLDQYLEDFYVSDKETSNPLAIPTTLYPRVVRGGGWNDDPVDLRSAARKASHPDWKARDPQLPQSIWYMTDAISVGFRVVRPLEEPSPEERAEKWDKTEPVQFDFR